jgi:hypothetical protein
MKLRSIEARDGEIKKGGAPKSAALLGVVVG